jgi:hypothetical protein
LLNTHTSLWNIVSLEQIASCLNRYAIQTGRVNLLYPSDVERIHAFEPNRSAAQIKRDPF